MMDQPFDANVPSPSDLELHERFMLEALKEAEQAREEGEVPVGAVIVHNGRVIGRAHNQREALHDPTAHAEMIAITQAAEALGNWRLLGADIYVTLEPCAMCAGAMVLGRIERLFYGTPDPKAGACGTVLDVLGTQQLNHRVQVFPGILAQACARILSDFFRERRQTLG